MLIGIDGNEANIAKRVGISEYSFEILRCLKSMQAEDITWRIYLKNPPLPDLPPISANWEYMVVQPKRLWTQIALPVALFTHLPRPNVFFSPTHYAPRFSPVPTVISVMDVSYMRFPELFAKKDYYQLKHWTAYSVRKATKIFTISQSSKNDIIRYYNISQEKVVVTYPGIKEKSITMNQDLHISSLQKKYSIAEKYILFVGTIQPRKNISRLIEAFSTVVKKHPQLQLIIVGKRGWLFEPILRKPSELGISEKVNFLNYITDEELHVLYKHALCYVLPSLYEGFGLPILEAMQYGCPVITSNKSSLPEAGGDAAVYVDPEKVSEISDKIMEVIENEKLRVKMIEKGYAHIKKFSWEKTAKQTLQVLKQIGEKSV